MFANTITLTVNAVAKVLRRVNQDNYGSEYSLQSATESIVMKIRHSVDAVDKITGVGMKRHNVFVEWVVFPNVTDLEKRYTYTATLRNGEKNDPAQVADLALAVNVWLASTTIMDDLAVGDN
nr:MAG: hypothetical protein 2 [Leviviridae sp.]